MTIREMLDQNIPRDVITTRQQSGKSLSYLEGWYVIDRLNQVLGTENWSWSIDRLDTIPGEKMSFICQGEIRAVIDGKEVAKSGLGYGSDKGNFNAGEMGSKEAETDAFKRAAMKFGRSLGLALYDKTQEFVGEQQDTQSKPKTSKETPAVAKEPAKPVTAPAVDKGQVTKSLIKQAFGVLQAQKKISKEDFVSEYLKGSKTDDLTDTQSTEVLNKLKTSFPELKL